MPPPPDQIQTRWFHDSLLGNRRRKPRRLDASPQRGVKETFWSRHRYATWGSWVPLMGHRVCQNVSHPLCRFIPRSGCSGWLWPIDGFCLWTLSFGCLGYDCHLPWRIGRIIWGVGWRGKSFLPHLFTTPVEPSHFASSVSHTVRP
jgi:hypothetical protein